MDVVCARDVRPRPGIRLIASSTFCAAELDRYAGIPTATIARIALDLGRYRSCGAVASVLGRAAYRGLLDLEECDEVVDRNRGTHAGNMLRRALKMTQYGAGTLSGLEDLVLGWLDERRCTTPVVNGPIHARGRTMRVDFHWPQLRLVLEVDGPGHRAPDTMRDDADRDARLRADGWTVIRWTLADIENRGEALADDVACELTNRACGTKRRVTSPGRRTAAMDRDEPCAVGKVRQMRASPPDRSALRTPVRAQAMRTTNMARTARSA